jgi:hypothetical protein
MATSRSATFDELDAVKKELQTLEGRVDRIVTGLNAALQHAQQADRRLRRTERLDVARLQAHQGLDVTWSRVHEPDELPPGEYSPCRN